VPQDLPPGWSRTPPVPPEPAPRDYGPPERHRRGALLALAVAAVGVGALVVGVREAVRRIPPDAEARAQARGDSIRAARQGSPAGRGRGSGGGPRGEDVPRLR
jgi:hypothetical protein